MIDDFAGTGTIDFSYDAPVVDSVIMTNPRPTIGGFSITVLGRNLMPVQRPFYAPQPAGQKPSLNVGSTPCLDVAWVTQTSVACRVQPGSGAQLSIVVGASRIFGTLSPSLFSYDAPVLSHVKTMNLAATASKYDVTVSGKNFNNGGDDNRVSVHSADCLPVWHSDSSVTCSGIFVQPGMQQSTVTVDGTSR